MQTHAVAYFWLLAFFFIIFILHSCRLWNLFSYTLLYGFKKKNQQWITLFCCWNVAYTLLPRRKQGVLFQQDVFPFILTFVIFALSWNQKKKKKVTLGWTCGDMFRLRKICDAWKVAHLSEMTQKADAIVLRFCALPFQQAAADAY